MRQILVILSFIYFLFPVSVYATIKNEVRVNSNTDGGDSSVKVNINNQVNTNDSQDSPNSETNVKIHQSGEGEASVKVNDKEYNLEGPGDLNVSESSDSESSSEQSPTSIPTIISSPTPSVTPAIKGISTSTMPGKLKIEWNNVITWLQNLVNRFSKLF